MTQSDQQRIADLGLVPVEVVARVVLAPAAVERMVALPQDRLKRQRQQATDYQSSLQQEAESAAEQETDRVARQ